MQRGLFLNTRKAQCSIHESGMMVYNALCLSNNYQLDYREIDSEFRTIPGNYDFFIFNYHPFVMGWLDTTKLKNLPGLYMTLVLETLPNDPFPMCPRDDFDVYLAIDPTMKIDDDRVYAFPRPLEPLIPLPYVELEIPVIGTFGFATAGKGFEYVVDAVNKEFDRAVVRIHTPSGSYVHLAKKIFRGKPMYSETFAERCANLANDGIEVQVTHDYMDKQQLVNWCGQNTLNVFLYNRNQPGLSATTDQAISSGRPLAISTCETFRHIHQYVTPYPKRTLPESITQSLPEVVEMQARWHPVQFALFFELVLHENPCKSAYTGEIILPKKNDVLDLYNRNVQRVSFFLNPPDEGIPKVLPRESRVMFVSPKDKQCGMYQYGRNIFNSLRKSKKYWFVFCECGDKYDLDAAVNYYNPMAIIYNFHPMTMTWLTRWITRKYSMPQLGLIHEFTQATADRTTNTVFDYSLYQDPDLIERNPYAIKTKQLVYPYVNTIPLPPIPTIGSFGFGTPGKGFERLVDLVQEEYDVAHIRFHIPYNDVVDVDGKLYGLPTAQRCRERLYKPGVTLTITHEFLTEPQLLDFLAGNTINAFLYDTDMTVGISGPGLHALAVHRPIAITKCGMFRHLLNTTPPICVEDLSLKGIIANGTAPLERFYTEWSEDAFVKDYERILDKVLK